MHKKFFWVGKCAMSFGWLERDFGFSGYNMGFCGLVIVQWIFGEGKYSMDFWGC